MSRTLARIAALLLLLTAVASGVAPPAGAHTALISSTPAADARWDIAPARVELTFNEEISSQFATLLVTGPAGHRADTAEIQVSGNIISVPLETPMPAADYTVAYRVVSADGHPVSGQFGFVVTASAPGASTSPPAASAPSAQPESHSAATEPAAESPTPLWVWALVGVGGAIVALLIVRRVARRRS